MGPDFKEGEIINSERELTDVPATIAELMGFEMPSGNGEIMEELLKK